MASRLPRVLPKRSRGSGDRWRATPSLRRFIFDGLRMGGICGAIVGFLPVISNPRFLWDTPSQLLSVPLGFVVGATYGLALALTAWPVGLLLVEKWRLLSGKGLGLGIGVSLVAAVAIAATWPAGGPWGADSVDFLVFVLLPGLVATTIAVLAGLRYDRSR